MAAVVEQQQRRRLGLLDLICRDMPPESFDRVEQSPTIHAAEEHPVLLPEVAHVAEHLCHPIGIVLGVPQLDLARCARVHAHQHGIPPLPSK
jgi:hypothetical protein